jgi:nucleolar GTP-binding protein
MSLHDIKYIEKAQTYLDVAVKRALKIKSQNKRGEPFDKAKPREQERMVIIRDYLVERLDGILKNFPVFDDLPEFYRELVMITLEYEKMRKALTTVNWAAKTISDISAAYKRKIRASMGFGQLDLVKKSYLGRISSIMDKIAPSLLFLNETRKIIMDYPIIKTDLFTICISGFPNIGKSTLLNKITTAKPDIQAYAFTTKTLNLGYAVIDGKKVQFVDTPGTLDRPEKMNNIEKQAYLAIKHQANLIIYIFDLTEPYPIEDQKKLLEKLRRFGKPMIFYLSKTDILEDSVVKGFDIGHTLHTTIEGLKKAIVEQMVGIGDEKKEMAEEKNNE